VIGWQNLAALWALPVIAAPILIHLLRRRRADRVPFPSLRFVASAQTSAARFRRLSDRWLLVLRIAVLASGIAALAKPVLLTSARMETWNASTARAILVDTSASMRATANTDRANHAADANARSAAYSRRFDEPMLADGVARAAAWLTTTPPSRKEIVVVTDAQRGAVDPASISQVPATIGIRIVDVGTAVPAKRIEGAALLGLDSTGSFAQHVALTADATELIIERRQHRRRTGIRILPDAASDSLLRVVARAGAIAGSPEEPIVIRFSDADATTGPSRPTPVRSGWMLRRVLRLQEAIATARQLAADVRALDNRTSSAWSAVFTDDAGRPIVAAAASGDELLLDVGTRAHSMFAAAIVRAALNARVAPADYQEQEIARTEDAMLNALARAAAPVEEGAWRNADATDSRWCWVLALVLLGVEQWLRRRPAERETREATRAAA
jgi:hypothetical protein